MNKIFLNNLEFYLPKRRELNIDVLNFSKKNEKDSLNIISKIGIKERRISSNKEFSTDLAINAAKKILKKVKKNKIDFLIYCTNTPDYLLPSNSCLIHDKLKLKKNVGAFDIILACSGYVYSLSVAKSLVQSGIANKILLITADTYSKFIPYKDSKNRVLFGDGSSSNIISKNNTKGSFEILNFLHGTDGSGYKNAIIKNFGNKFRLSKNKSDNNLFLDGPGLYQFALNNVPEQIQVFLKKNKLKFNEIDYFVFHQANKFMLKGLQQAMKIPNDRIIINMQNTGNTTSSSIPISLKKYEKKFKKGNKILLAGFGGGLSWGICLLKKH
jgi:3-oxoacyl-[acyl-carrier-protein] synthase III